MIRLNLQLFGGRGGGSGGAGGKGSGGGAGGGGTGASGGGNGGGGKLNAAKEEPKKTGPVTKLEPNERYDVYVVRDGKVNSRSLEDNLSAAEVRSTLNRPVYDSKTDTWKNKYGKVYKIRRVQKDKK